MLLYRWVSVILAFSALSFADRSAYAQSDEEKAAARALAKQGAEAFAEGKHTDALDLMTRAEAIIHAPTHLLYIARSQAALGKLVAAKETYLKVMREELGAGAPKAFKDAQEQAKQESAAIEPRIASLRIVLENPASRKVTVKMDGQAVSAALIGVHRPVDPGKHVVVAYPVGGSPVEQPVELKDGEKGDIKLAIPVELGTGVPASATDDPDAGSKPQGPDTTKPSGGGISGLAIAGIATGAVGLGGVVVGAIFLSKRGKLTRDADDKNAACESMMSCPVALQNEIRGLDSDAAQAGTIGVIGLVAGGVLLAGGATMAVLGFTAKKPQPKPASAWVAPWISPSGVGLVGAF